MRGDCSARMHLVQSERRFAQADVDVLRLGVGVHDDLVRLAADAGLLVAAERCVRGQLVVGVDPHTPGLNRLRDAERAVDVLRPDGAAEPVLAVVRHLDDLRFVVELDEADDRAEDLFACDAHVVRDVGDDGRLHECAAFEPRTLGACAAADDACALFLCDVDVFETVL